MPPKAKENTITVKVVVQRSLQKFEPLYFEAEIIREVDPKLTEGEVSNLRKSMTDELTAGMETDIDEFVQRLQAYNPTTAQEESTRRPATGGKTRPAAKGAKRPASGSRTTGRTRQKASQKVESEDLGEVDAPVDGKRLGISYQISAEAYSCEDDILRLWKLNEDQSQWIEAHATSRNWGKFDDVFAKLNGDPRKDNIVWQDTDDIVAFADGQERLLYIEHSRHPKKDSDFAWVNLVEVEIMPF